MQSAFWKCENILFYSELSSQFHVDNITHSRAEMDCEKRFLRSSDSLFMQSNCHMWHLRVSHVTSDPLTYGIWRPHSLCVTPSDATSDNHSPAKGDKKNRKPLTCNDFRKLLFSHFCLRKKTILNRPYYFSGIITTWACFLLFSTTFFRKSLTRLASMLSTVFL